MTRPGRITPEEVDAALGVGSTWTRRGDVLHLEHRFASFAAAVGFVAAVATHAAALDHHPDIDVRYDRVVLEVTTHDAGGLTQLDLELARRVEALLAHPST